MDNQSLNAKARLVFYSLLLSEDILHLVSQSKWFSTWWISPGPLDEHSKERFSKHLGHFEYNVIPFGLSSAQGPEDIPKTCVKGLQLFLDDIAVYRK